jgi:uncharacterized protein YjeT (DUF2065 family)
MRAPCTLCSGLLILLLEGLGLNVSPPLHRPLILQVQRTREAQCEKFQEAPSPKVLCCRLPLLCYTYFIYTAQIRPAIDVKLGCFGELV